MLRLLSLALCCVACASAPPPEPKVIERVVYVEAPCRTPVSVEHHGHGHDGHYAKAKARYRRQGKNPHRAEGFRHRMERCDRKPTEKARDKCRRAASRSARRHP